MNEDDIFDPDLFDMDAEIERVTPHWIEPFLPGGELLDWQQKLRDDPEALKAKQDDWRTYTQRNLDKARRNLTARRQLNEEHNYRFHEVTFKHWHHLTSWGVAEDITEYPTLLLGSLKGPLTFRPDCPWDPAIYSNQTAGYACHHPTIHGVVLPLSDKGYRIANQIQQEFLDSQLGWMSENSLNDIIKYRSFLQERGLDCNYTYETLEEAWYPVDLAYLPLLADVPALQGIDVSDPRQHHDGWGDVADWANAALLAPHEPDPDETPWQRISHEWYRVDWRVFIAGENSD